MTDFRAWNETRYAVWRRRILAVKDGQTVRSVEGQLMVTKVCNEGRRLSAVMRAWDLACRRLND